MTGRADGYPMQEGHAVRKTRFYVGDAVRVMCAGVWAEGWTAMGGLAW